MTALTDGSQMSVAAYGKIPDGMSRGFAAVVVTPTFNNAETVVGILERIIAVGLPVIVVNDGSTDDTADRLAAWCAADHGVAVDVATHEQNKGKATALATGRLRACELGYTHMVSIDTDGQLDPEEIPGLLDAAQKQPEALVLGVRSAMLEHTPARSLIGRRLSNLAIRLECGQSLIDSQCGLRVYPLAMLSRLRCRAGHFAFETEVLTRAAWAGYPIVQIPVTSRYLPAGERVSHFRPWLDSWRCVRLHARLLSRAFLPWPHHRHCQLGPGETSLREWVRSFSPRQMWRQLHKDDLGRLSLAAGLGVGTFIANLPCYGLHTVLSLYTARRLHLPPLAVVLGSLIATPPMGPILIGIAVIVGHLMLHGDWPHWEPEAWAQVDVSTLVGMVLLEWLVGSLVVATVSLVATFGLVLALGSVWDRALGSDKVPSNEAPCNRSNG